MLHSKENKTDYWFLSTPHSLWIYNNLLHKTQRGNKPKSLVASH